MGLALLIKEEFMAFIIQQNTANDLWKIALEEIHKNGHRQKDTIEISQAVLTLRDPLQKWVSDRSPAMSIAFALVELVWIFSGSNKRTIIDYWNPAYKKYAADEQSDIYHGAYGYRLKHYNGIDQIERAYSALSNCPENRQTILLYWDPLQDMPLLNGKSQSSDIPCNICSMLKIRDGKLEWTQVMRSNDVFKGLPYNLVQFTSLQEILAGWLGVEVGTYTHLSDSLHLYGQDINCCAKHDIDDLNKESISISKADFESVISEMSSRLERIATEELSSKELKKLAILGSKYEAYNNMMLIICSYASNKSNYDALTKELLSRCSNTLYVKMMQAFLNKLQT